MRLFIVIISVTLCASEDWGAILEKAYLGSVYKDTCIDDQHAVSAFRSSFDAFNVQLFINAAPQSKYFMTLSPLLIWITLAAVAEGADLQTQTELFRILNLPQNPCSRQKFYRIATTRISSSKYGNVINTRALVIDQGVQVNPSWYEFVGQHSLLQVETAPIKHDPALASAIIQKVTSTNNRGLNLNGNSVLLNTMDFNGLWTSAFAGAVIERAPFYSKKGQPIGSVDLMKLRRKARIGYVSTTNLKVIELPVGINSEYRMIFALVVSDDANVVPMFSKLNNNSISEVLGSLQDSTSPIEISIPRFVMNSEIDVKKMLLDMGVVNLWKDPEATRFISNPPAQPSSYIQQATVTLNNEGIKPPPLAYSPVQYSTHDERYWNEFVADRPFMFGLYDAETYTCLMGTMFTKPTYPY